MKWVSPPRRRFIRLWFFIWDFEIPLLFPSWYSGDDSRLRFMMGVMVEKAIKNDRKTGGGIFKLIEMMGKAGPGM
jgi:hypothetical protein